MATEDPFLAWDVLAEPGVLAVIEAVAWSVANEYDWTEVTDLIQTASERVVIKQDLWSLYSNHKLLHYRLRRDLMDSIKTEARRRSLTSSYDVHEEEPPKDRFGSPVSMDGPWTTHSDYNRESVEALLPAVWDESFAYGLTPKEGVPEPGTPMGYKNKAHGNTHWALLADIRSSWKHCSTLTDKERRALLLRFGVYWNETEIGFNQGVSQQAISMRLTNAIGKIVAHLNGSDATTYEED